MRVTLRDLHSNSALVQSSSDPHSCPPISQTWPSLVLAVILRSIGELTVHCESYLTQEETMQTGSLILFFFEHARGWHACLQLKFLKFVLLVGFFCYQLSLSVLQFFLSFSIARCELLSERFSTSILSVSNWCWSFALSCLSTLVSLASSSWSFSLSCLSTAISLVSLALSCLSTVISLVSLASSSWSFALSCLSTAISLASFAVFCLITVIFLVNFALSSLSEHRDTLVEFRVVFFEYHDTLVEFRVVFFEYRDTLVEFRVVCFQRFNLTCHFLFHDFESSNSLQQQVPAGLRQFLIRIFRHIRNCSSS
eukprot:TRINITY_DN1430_c0_g1_i13.p1 TRINITY_DN1430_c0_g1~~TRINITY_DN1430_c0_g1_i13.p1  ORF type:complete len:310 (-),score=-15.14 TRINITY_DN1430_c0_g1_i13:998-1927(-)